MEAKREAKRSRHSAGLVMFRRRGGTLEGRQTLEGHPALEDGRRVLEVFLVHPGGPYWARRDAGAWSIPKGEYAPDEDALAAARREVREETGFAPAGPFVPLTPCRQPGGKWISAWAVEAPDLVPSRLRSNDFTLEWPPRSGVMRQFPEVDRGAWFALPEAHERLIAGQRALLGELMVKIAGPDTA